MADLNLGMKCIKYMLLTVNAMFMLTATLIITIGTTIYSIYGNFTHFISDAYFSPASLLIAIGIIMLIVSVFGCMGAAKESTCMINVFSLLLTLIFIMEIAAAIAAYSLQSGLREMISNNLNASMQSYEESELNKKAIDILQDEWSCCGVNTYQDWINTPYGINNSNSIYLYPKSCCSNINTDEFCEPKQLGCLPQMKNIISQSAILLGTGALTIAFIQFIGIIFSVMLGKSIRQAKTDRERRRWEIREQMVNNAYSQMERHHGKTLDNPAPVIYVPTIGQTQA